MINLTTLEAVKSLVEETGSSFDTDILDRIATVSYRVQQVYDVDLEAQTHTEIHSGGGKRIYPRNVPVTSVTTIKQSSSLIFADGDLVPAVDYKIVNQGWDIAHYARWDRGRDNIELVYVAGYIDALSVSPVTDVPLWLQKAVATQVAFEFNNRKSIGMSTVDYPDGTVTKENRPFLREVEISLNTLRKYKIG